jgi:plastocyanin
MINNKKTYYLLILTMLLNTGFSAIKGNVYMPEKTGKPRSGIKNALIYISKLKTKPPKAAVSMAQKQVKFDPKILPVVIGQRVNFPNLDNIYHNIFSITEPNSFDLGHYKNDPKGKSITFKEAGIVPVYCNIHPQMLGYIVVLENKYFTRSDKNGEFQFDKLPNGTYQINAWLPRYKTSSQPITIKNGKVKETITMTLNKKKRYSRKHKRKNGSRYPKRMNY